MATALEWIAWTVFVLVISLLFFAAFGGSKYSETNIEEYMDKLIAEEMERSGSQGNMEILWKGNYSYSHTRADSRLSCQDEDLAV